MQLQKDFFVLQQTAPSVREAPPAAPRARQNGRLSAAELDGAVTATAAAMSAKTPLPPRHASIAARCKPA